MNFARTGEPGGGWTAYTAENPAVNEIGDGIVMVDISERPVADSISDEMIAKIYG